MIFAGKFMATIAGASCMIALHNEQRPWWNEMDASQATRPSLASSGTVCEANEDLKALIAAAPEFAGPGFLVPTRNGELFRWCLAHGLRMAHPMTLMSVGLYNEPTGGFLPSILY